MAQKMGLRQAIEWISGQRTDNPQARLIELMNQASFRFDLSPAQDAALIKELMPEAAPGK